MKIILNCAITKAILLSINFFCICVQYNIVMDVFIAIYLKLPKLTYTKIYFLLITNFQFNQYFPDLRKLIYWVKIIEIIEINLTTQYWIITTTTKTNITFLLICFRKSFGFALPSYHAQQKKSGIFHKQFNWILRWK